MSFVFDNKYKYFAFYIFIFLQILPIKVGINLDKKKYLNLLAF